MSKPYVVNVSSINDFANCRFRWYCRWVLNRVPAEEGRPLGFGKLYHTLMERHLGGVSMATAIATTRAQWEKEAAEASPDTQDFFTTRKALEDLASMEEPLSLWADKYAMEAPLEIETPFEIPFPGDPSIHFLGRPDRVAVLKSNSRLYHVQNKSLAATTNFALYGELAKRSYHEHVYAEALAQKYLNYEYGGTLFNFYRKLKYRKAPTKKEPEGAILHTLDEMFWQHPMVVNVKSPLHGQVMNSIHGHIIAMRATEEWMAAIRDKYDRWTFDFDMIPVNERMNGGFYGNQIDPYFRVLVGEIKLSDDTYFKDRQSTYDTEPASL